VQGLKLSISDHPVDTDWMCGPVNGVSVYILQINRVNPDTEAEWKYAGSSTRSGQHLLVPSGGEKVQCAAIDLKTASALLWGSRWIQVR
jgi:hypothetical protein